MKKLSLSLLVAVLAVGYTFASNLDALTSKKFSGCWRANTIQIQVRDLANPSSPTPSEVFTPVYLVTNCYTVDAQVFISGKNYLRLMSGNIVNQPLCDLTSQVFCCLELEEISNPNDPLYQDVPFVNLGPGLKKYQITQVYCTLL